MKDDLKGKGKKAAKDGDEEMTVVVPKTRPVKSSAPPDKDGDVAMGDEADKDAEGEVKVDPVVQTSTGELLIFFFFLPQTLLALLSLENELFSHLNLLFSLSRHPPSFFWVTQS